ncbi:MAG: 30S ribosomal protein S6 [Holosporales bacterium]|jgi:small subunit ribosomal protein S6|nr:30S ribosomal protein S6 [Holosporales bacterium]
MRRYENVFIARQDLTPPQVEALMAEFVDVVKDLGGVVARYEYCGLRSLAYRIRNNRKGHYCLLHVEASHETLKQMERRMRLSEEVLRFMSIAVNAFDEGPCPLAYTRSFREKDEGDSAFLRSSKEDTDAKEEEPVNG